MKPQDKKTRAPVAIPDMWLVGRCHILEQDGYDPLAAIEEAVRQWLEQETAEARHDTH